MGGRQGQRAARPANRPPARNRRDGAGPQQPTTDATGPRTRPQAPRPSGPHKPPPSSYLHPAPQRGITSSHLKEGGTKAPGQRPEGAKGGHDRREGGDRGKSLRAVGDNRLGGIANSGAAANCIFLGRCGREVPPPKGGRPSGRKPSASRCRPTMTPPPKTPTKQPRRSSGRRPPGGTPPRRLSGSVVPDPVTQ